MAFVSRMDDFIRFAKLREQELTPDRIFHQKVAPVLQEIRILHTEQIKEASDDLSELASSVQSIKLKTLDEKLTALETALKDLSGIAAELTDEESWKKMDAIIQESTALSEKLQKHLTALRNSLRCARSH